MRHLIGIVLAIVTAVAVFFAGGWGYLRLLRFLRPLGLGAATGAMAQLPASGGSLMSDHIVLAALAALLAVGLVLGIMIGTPAISPLAPGLPGLAMLALTGLYLADVRRAVTLIPLRTGSFGFGAGLEDMLASGVLAMAGLAMIVPLFVPSRWRRRNAWADEDEDEDGSVLAAIGHAPEQPGPGVAPPGPIQQRTQPPGPIQQRTQPTGPIQQRTQPTGPIQQGPRRGFPPGTGGFPPGTGEFPGRTGEFPPQPPSIRPPQDPLS